VSGNVRKWATSKWSMLLSLLLLAFAGALLIVSIVNTNRYQRCVANWADQFTRRTTTLSAASAVRNNALDLFVRSLATRDEKRELAAYNAYLKASDEYSRELKANPPPTPPKLRC
jgi:hypothetical protein